MGVHGRKRESLTDASEYFVKYTILREMSTAKL